MMSRFFLLLLLLSTMEAGSLFDNLAAIISDPAHSTPSQNNNHQFLFQPIGKYATDIHYLHIRLPIYLDPVLQAITNMSDFMHDIAKQTSSKATTLVIQDIIMFSQMCLDILRQNFVNLIANLPSKSFSDSHFKNVKFLNYLASLVLLSVLQTP